MPRATQALLRLQRGLAPLIVLALLSLATGPAAASEPKRPAVTARIDPTKAALIRQVIDATGATRNAQENVDQMIDMLRKASPDTPELLWVRLREKVDPREIFDIVVAVYDRHYSLEEIRGLLAFYESPAGKVFLREMPKANQEVEQEIEAWSGRVATELIQELAAGE